MSKLHELLAVEKTRVSAAAKLMEETLAKFQKIEFFQGHNKTLKMIEESPNNAAVEKAGSETKNLPTTVTETLTYLLGYWAKAEDVMFQKNVTNQRAVSDLLFDGKVIAKEVPVDELMGLENRLLQIRNLVSFMPTLPATVQVKEYPESGRVGAWIGNKESTVKTEKSMVPVILYEATAHHPAQVKESTVDKVVGTYELTKIYGSATSQQKANVLAVVDELIVQVKQARMRANSVDVVDAKIGDTITSIILSALK